MNWFNSNTYTIVKKLKIAFAAINNKCKSLFGLLKFSYCSFNWSSYTILAISLKYLIVLSFSMFLFKVYNYYYKWLDLYYLIISDYNFFEKQSNSLQLDYLISHRMFIEIILLIMCILTILLLIVFKYNLIILLNKDKFIKIFDNKFLIFYVKYIVFYSRITWIYLPIWIFLGLFTICLGLIWLITNQIPYVALGIDLHQFNSYKEIVIGITLYSKEIKFSKNSYKKNFSNLPLSNRVRNKLPNWFKLIILLIIILLISIKLWGLQILQVLFTKKFWTIYFSVGLPLVILELLSKLILLHLFRTRKTSLKKLKFLPKFIQPWLKLTHSLSTLNQQIYLSLRKEFYLYLLFYTVMSFIFIITFFVI